MASMNLQRPHVEFRPPLHLGHLCLDAKDLRDGTLRKVPTLIGVHRGLDVVLSLAFFSMITMLGTPRAVTLQQLKIECFFQLTQAPKRSHDSSRSPNPVAV
jgi:hypothetical protein